MNGLAIEGESPEVRKRGAGQAATAVKHAQGSQALDSNRRLALNIMKAPLHALIVGEGHAKVPSSRKRLFSRIGPVDLGWAALSPVLAFIIRDGAINRIDIAAFYLGVAVLASLVTFQWFRISSPIPTFFSVRDAFTIAKACLTAVAITAMLVFLVTRLDDAPRSVPAIHFLVLLSGLVGSRALGLLIASEPAARRAEEVNDDVENTLVIGATRLAWLYMKLLEECQPVQQRIVALLDEQPGLRNRTLNGYPVVGVPDAIARIIDEYATHGVAIQKVVIALSPKDFAGATWIEVQTACKSRNIDIEWLHERLSLPATAASRSPTATAGERLASLSPGWSFWKTKRLIDILVSLALLIVMAPLTLLVSILILIDVGLPLVFWQQRIGHLGRPLHVYKFRTMRNIYGRDGRPVPDEARVSALGHLLRRSRLDEIPQLFNILIGNMSLIGPRPLLPADQPKNMRLRLQVRPGLTGLAQINGGKLLSPEEKDALDEWYIQNASLWLDLKIMLRTIWVVLRGDLRNEAQISTALAEKAEACVPMTVVDPDVTISPVKADATSAAG